jgi:hypothetical protein
VNPSFCFQAFHRTTNARQRMAFKQFSTFSTTFHFTQAFRGLYKQRCEPRMKRRRIPHDRIMKTMPLLHYFLFFHSLLPSPSSWARLMGSLTLHTPPLVYLYDRTKPMMGWGIFSHHHETDLYLYDTHIPNFSLPRHSFGLHSGFLSWCGWGRFFGG